MARSWSKWLVAVFYFLKMKKVIIVDDEVAGRKAQSGSEWVEVVFYFLKWLGVGRSIKW